jgi:hypothetical protein
MCNQRKITLIEFLVYWVERGPIRGKLLWIPLWLAAEKLVFYQLCLQPSKPKENYCQYKWKVSDTVRALIWRMKPFWTEAIWKKKLYFISSWNCLLLATGHQSQRKGVLILRILSYKCCRETTLQRATQKASRDIWADFETTQNLRL